jgi:hypothetical protein
LVLFLGEQKKNKPRGRGQNGRGTAPNNGLGKNTTRLAFKGGSRLRKQVRRIPDVQFFLDDTLDEMFRLRDLFQRLHDDNQMGSDSEE